MQNKINDIPEISNRFVSSNNSIHYTERFGSEF